MTHDHTIPRAWSCGRVGPARPTRLVAEGLAAGAMRLARRARSSARLSVSGFPPGSAPAYPTPDLWLRHLSGAWQPAHDRLSDDAGRR